MSQPLCELCGTPVRIVSGGEGTTHYEPIEDVRRVPELERLVTSFKQERDTAQAEVERLRARDEILSGVLDLFSDTDGKWSVHPQFLWHLKEAHRLLNDPGNR